jgi:ABC-type phosphate transport system substrate-binding protein
VSNCAGMRAGVGVVVCVTALLIGACSAKTASFGESSTVTSASTSPAPATAQRIAITIEGSNFILADPVPPGAQISVTNKDSVDHTLTADPPAHSTPTYGPVQTRPS